MTEQEIADAKEQLAAWNARDKVIQAEALAAESEQANVRVEDNTARSELKAALETYETEHKAEVEQITARLQAIRDGGVAIREVAATAALERKARGEAARVTRDALHAERLQLKKDYGELYEQVGVAEKELKKAKEK